MQQEFWLLEIFGCLWMSPLGTGDIINVNKASINVLKSGIILI